ncbi:hypothetical protein LOK49_LG09G01248 [Camellia lanceoleosa]|uniref:Uncharacterized protein n=1 Tax=Camellia lanceoleosa TaxID=1840588 RepID=A0ACC0GLL6_9ERIC|nr:hypothetical protein LOK49_LG09G01248 [Camellia lanceoleosa]
MEPEDVPVSMYKDKRDSYGNDRTLNLSISGAVEDSSFSQRNQTIPRSDGGSCRHAEGEDRFHAEEADRFRTEGADRFRERDMFGEEADRFREKRRVRRKSRSILRERRVWRAFNHSLIEN